MAAQALQEHWRDGVWWVDLSTLADPAQLPQRVAQALRIARPQHGSTADHLVAVLASMSLLLVLDNCEHLVDAAGALSERIVSHASGVHVLATSQELLNVPSEALFKLGPLAVPAPASSAEFGQFGQFGQFGSVQLFVQRARSADARFALSADNAQAVADICRRLDGLPLAIELAAARVRLLGVHGLRDRLDERFRLLTGGSRTAMRRHQTLRAALDWSHNLLAGTEQVVLRRLGVFVNGFSLELAQALVQDDHIDEWAALDALGALADKSLVMADAAEPPRYHLLETTRAYALEKLAEAGETDAWMERHARVVCAFFERLEEARGGEEGTLSHAAYSGRAGPELDNVRSALAWACRQTQQTDLAVGLAGAAQPVFATLFLSVEAAELLMSLRARVDASVAPQRSARFWTGLASLGLALRVPLHDALDAADRAEPSYRAQQMNKRRSFVLSRKIALLTFAGEWRAAQALLPVMRELEAPNWAAWRVGLRMHAQAWILVAQGELEAALALHRDLHALMLQAKGEDRSLLDSESELCRYLYLTARYDECIAQAGQSVARVGGSALGHMPVLSRHLMLAQAVSGRMGDACQTLLECMPGWRRHGVFQASGALAVVLAALGHWADAARVDAASINFLRRTGMVYLPSLQRANEHTLALLAAAACDAADLARWQHEGEALDEAAIEAICLRAVEDSKFKRGFFSPAGHPAMPLNTH